jgi:hypothetical protein
VIEAEFQRQVTDLAAILGYAWSHFRPAQTARGWRTPVSGPMGKGWPDLTLAKEGRLIFAELKVGKNKLSPEQAEVLATLRLAGAETYVWFPEDIEVIADILAAKSNSISFSGLA